MMIKQYKASIPTAKSSKSISIIYPQNLKANRDKMREIGLPTCEKQRVTTTLKGPKLATL